MKEALAALLGVPGIVRHLDALARTAIADYRERHLFSNPRYLEPGRLNRYEYQVYSQSGEDGILDEIFSRLGIAEGFFVEIGAGDGLTNNTVYRLARGWRGLWLEGSESRMESILRIHDESIRSRRLAAKGGLVTAENVERLLREADVPEELELLSIDIDGNDYWVWKSLQPFRPRVVIIEYNAAYPPRDHWVRPYDPLARWDGTHFFGASLKALERLGDEMGYRLVGCSFSGVNAFFVRNDAVGDRFCAPFTAENHYEPARYHLIHEPPFPRRFAPGVARS